MQSFGIFYIEAIRRSLPKRPHSNRIASVSGDKLLVKISFIFRYAVFISPWLPQARKAA